MKTIFTQPMNENEIKEALKLFKKLLSKRANIYTYEHANPIQQNCYISSCDCIIGVYFPNSVIKATIHKNYTICSLSKVNNKLGVVFSLNDDFANSLSEKEKIYFDDYIFYSFDDLLYTYEEKKIKEAIEKRIKDYTHNLETLSKIKRVYKKNGEPFARLLDNFTGVNIRLNYCILSPVVSSIKINYDELWLYRTQENKEKCDIPTLEEMTELLRDTTERTTKALKQEKENLKQLETTFKRFEKLTKALKSFFDETPNKYDYKKQLEYMIL